VFVYSATKALHRKLLCHSSSRKAIKITREKVTLSGPNTVREMAIWLRLGSHLVPGHRGPILGSTNASNNRRGRTLYNLHSMQYQMIPFEVTQNRKTQLSECKPPQPPQHHQFWLHPDPIFMAWALFELETPRLLQQCLLPSALLLWTAVLSSALKLLQDWAGLPRARPNWGVGLACLTTGINWELIRLKVNGLPVSAGLHDVKASESHLEGLAKLQTNTSTSQRVQSKGNKVYELPVTFFAVGRPSQLSCKTQHLRCWHIRFAIPGREYFQ